MAEVSTAIEEHLHPFARSTDELWGQMNRLRHPNNRNTVRQLLRNFAKMYDEATTLAIDCRRRRRLTATYLAQIERMRAYEQLIREHLTMAFLME